MSRTQKRKAEREAANIVTNAKKDMIAWVQTLDHTPDVNEMKAWQAGYISGVGRLQLAKDEND